MTAESDAFEQLNARIQRLLRGTSAKVTWNGFVSDPDAPDEQRQIDVLIEEGGRRIGVECRDRSAAQTVMWVEELIGRKQSLGLDSVIGVAVTGFTKLAQVKAKRHGVILYDFRTLSDAEIVSWTNAATVQSTFVKFEPLVIAAGVTRAQANDLSTEASFRHRGKDGYGAVMDAIRDDAAAHQGIERHTTLDRAGFDIDGVPLTFLVASYIGRLVPVTATCTAVEAFGEPEMPTLLRKITVQRFDHTASEIIHADNSIHVLLDVSSLNSPADSILHELKVTFRKTVTVSAYELVGSRSMLTKGTLTMLNVIAT